MKIILQCPNCQRETIIQLNNRVNSRRIKDAFAKSGTFCIQCRKDGLGPIQLKVKKFDWELDAKSIHRESDDHAPVKLDPSELSPEQIQKNIDREMKLRETESKKTGSL